MSNTMTTLTLAEALHALGPTQDAIAESLTAGGWQGKPLIATQCPLASYLRALGFNGACIDQMFASADDEEGSIETPEAIASFITAFDEGKYPGLVDEAPIHWGVHKTEPAPSFHEAETWPPPAGEEEVDHCRLVRRAVPQLEGLQWPAHEGHGLYAEGQMKLSLKVPRPGRPSSPCLALPPRMPAQVPLEGRLGR